MPVFASDTFDDASKGIDDAAPADGMNHGVHLHGAAATAWPVALDGIDDIARIFADPSFQLVRGTLQISFVQTAQCGAGPVTVLSRDHVGDGAGCCTIDMLVDGTIRFVNEVAGGPETFATATACKTTGEGITGTDQGNLIDIARTVTAHSANIKTVTPCFTPGTLIATPRGEVPIERLTAGDRVITRDNGLQEIRWTGAKVLSWQTLAANPHLQPVLIRRGSLGEGLPERDMMVSPNHRMLVENDRTALHFDEHEVLVAAKHLTGARGIHAVQSIGTTYLHILFDRHEVVLANGAWTESFQPADYTLKGMGNAQRSEIFELFPELKTRDGVEGYVAARRTLKRHEARLLAR